MVDRARHYLATVLIIAGDQIFAERFRRDLEDGGLRVWISPGWWLGVHLAGVETPELIVVDDALTDLDGLSVLAVLKAHPSTSGIPVVVAASNEGRQIRDRAQRLGALDVLLKTELDQQSVAGYLARAAGHMRLAIN